MTRTYSLVIEGDSNGYSAFVPELPSILVTGSTPEEITARAADAIRLYWETMDFETSPTALLREIEVELDLVK